MIHISTCQIHTVRKNTMRSQHTFGFPGCNLQLQGEVPMIFPGLAAQMGAGLSSSAQLQFLIPEVGLDTQEPKDRSYVTGHSSIWHGFLFSSLPPSPASTPTSSRLEASHSLPALGSNLKSPFRKRFESLAYRAKTSRERSRRLGH